MIFSKSFTVFRDKFALKQYQNRLFLKIFQKSHGSITLQTFLCPPIAKRKRIFANKMKLKS